MNASANAPASGTVASRLAAVRAAIARAAAEAGRDPAAITLVAVSKTNPVEAIAEAIAAGQRVFGENRVQEAQAKFPALRQRYPDLELRLIGHLQSNKAGDAVALFDVIESIDSEKLARAIAKEAQRQNRKPRCLIQVNIGAEAQKSGVAVEDTKALVNRCRDELGLAVDGLMCIPPAEGDPAPHFDRMRAMADRLDLKVRSMGMSGDYPQAIKSGATHVRVGTAIFGSRPYP